MATILCISSQIVRGRVGNSVAVHALQALGIDALSLPTVLLSETPGSGEVAGGALPDAMFSTLLDRSRGWLSELSAIHVGYFRTTAQVTAVTEFLRHAKASRPSLLVSVDPIMGDMDTGLYVSEPVADQVMREIVPLADLLTPNAWELERLSGVSIRGPRDVLKAATRLPCARLLCTSALTGPAAIANILCENGVGAIVTTPRHRSAPHGTGDLFAALFLAHMLGGRGGSEALELASASLHDFVAAADGADHLPTIEHPQLMQAPRKFPARWIAGDGDSPWVAGADGCRGGWIIALGRIDGGETRSVLCHHISEILALPEQPRVIALDVPIGLPARAIKGGRLCCNLARSKLGDRQSSVFSVPARAVLAAKSYAEACALNLENSDPPRKIAKQTFNILPRIAEVDAVITPPLQRRIFECHPEFAFTQMNGGEPLALAKKIKSRSAPDGMALRRKLLAKAGLAVPALPVPSAGIAYAEDDLLDACACLFAARRLARGEAIRLPGDPPLDERGLRMEILA